MFLDTATMQWEQVGTALRDSSVRVGAVNCVKHHDLCRSLKVGSYPSLLAVNTPGAPGGTAAEPSVTRITAGSKSLETVMTHVRDLFPGSVGGTPGALAVEVGRPRAEGGGGSGGGGNCVLRLEDATVSVRWVLRNDVFTQGEGLSEERMGKFYRSSGACQQTRTLECFLLTAGGIVRRNPRLR